MLWMEWKIWKMEWKIVFHTNYIYNCGVARNFKEGGHNLTFFFQGIFFDSANLKQIEKQKRLWGSRGMLPEKILKYYLL